jgi:hypothetical protein
VILCIGLLAALAPMAQAQLPPPREFCQEPFTISTVQISPIGEDATADFEFDQVGYQMMFSKNEKVFVQAVNPATGFLVGSFQRIDTRITHVWPELGIPLLGNGPEWAYSARGSELYYMKPYGAEDRNRYLCEAREKAPEEWAHGALPDGLMKGFPWPSKDVGDAVPRILYARSPTGVQSQVPYDVAVRAVPEDPATEKVIPAACVAKLGGPRWIAGRRKVVFTLLDAAGAEQVAIYDMDTGGVEQLTHYAPGSVRIDETWTSQVGGGFVVWFLANETEIRVLSKASGTWQEVNRVNPGEVLGRPDRPYVVSPEPFTYGGMPYIVFLLSSVPDNRELPADIYLMQPQSTSACDFRLISPDDNGVRNSPEFLKLVNGSGLVVYYIEVKWGFHTLYQADSGL